MEKRMGRPPKPEGTKSVVKTFSCSPELWAEVETFIPKRERSELIQECLAREVRQRRRKREKAQDEGDTE
jgi:hypothetical protein